jgi:hypothetical protein
MSIEIDNLKTFLIQKIEAGVIELAGAVFPEMNQDYWKKIPAVAIVELGATKRVRMSRDDNEVLHTWDEETGKWTVYKEYREAKHTIGLDLRCKDIAQKRSIARKLESFMVKEIEEKVFILEDKSPIRFVASGEALDLDFLDDRVYRQRFHYNVETVLILPDEELYYNVDFLQVGLYTTYKDLLIASGSDFVGETWIVSS